MKAVSSIQRIKKDASFNELQPPPYQDEGSFRSRSEREVRKGSSHRHHDSPCCSSETSEDQDTESYLNKGCEEDIPSDSTAVLGPEVGLKILYIPVKVCWLSSALYTELSTRFDKLQYYYYK